MIDRKKVINRQNPVLEQIDVRSPFSVGNGLFAYTFDVTGMQTLWQKYEDCRNPLCTMAEWGWHTSPFSKETFVCSREELEMTVYPYRDRNVSYAVEEKKGNEKVYQWFRHNPHRFSLAQIGLVGEKGEVDPSQLDHIDQKLDLWTGTALSQYQLNGEMYRAETAAAGQGCQVGFRLRKVYGQEGIHIRIRFGCPDYHSGGAVWNKRENHITEEIEESHRALLLRRTADRTIYYVLICFQTDHGYVERFRPHEYIVRCQSCHAELTVSFFQTQSEAAKAWREREEKGSFEAVRLSSEKHWKDYWLAGGMADFSQCRDPRASELERRMILSQYLTGVQCCGSVPPQETGLTCNSWYGKFHLEMHLWHAAHFPLWNRGEGLEKSMGWYKENLDKVRKNAARNGFAGARWPKMVGPDGEDSPSAIAPLLIWQQPHIIYMLELLYQEKIRRDKNAGEKFLREYWEIVKETGDFMADFAVWDPREKTYNLLPPIIPAQENHRPMDTKNPVFELEYWRFGLEVAGRWAVRLGKDGSLWKHRAEHMALPAYKDGVYLAHENCPDTFLRYNTDHPSMTAALGLLPGKGIDRKIMENTLDRIEDSWKFETMWGWDFAMMAMTAARLGQPERAVSFLLMDTGKNTYVVSGNNYQKDNLHLPLYLPGNGALLMAMAMMIGGWGETKDACPGFPKNGLWNIEYENIHGLPY